MFPVDHERKYQIFISSSYEELRDCRRDLILSILHAGHIPLGMEMFSSGAPPIEAIKEAIDRSDIYVALIGNTYGSPIENRSHQSYTQFEYDYAIHEKQKPHLIYVINKEEFESEATKIQKSKRTDEDERILIEIKSFRKNILKEEVAAYFSLREGGQRPHHTFAGDFHKLIRNEKHKLTGWIPAYIHDSIVNDQRVNSVIAKNDIVKKIVKEINKFETLANRMEKNANIKKMLGEFFWDRYGGTIFLSGYFDIFFESGSTIAYVSDSLLERLDTRFNDLVHGETRIRVRTNNILTQLLYVLLTGVDVRSVPPGPPEDKYGSMHGDLARAMAPQTPPQGPLETVDAAEDLVESVRKDLMTGTDKLLFLVGVSWLSLEFGPYIGNYPNTLLKRAIFRTKQPVILFADGTKIFDNSKPNAHFNVDTHFPVCTPSLSWKHLTSTYPIAICAAFPSSQYKRIAKSLQLANLIPLIRDEVQEGGSAYVLCLHANESFQNCIAISDAYGATIANVQ